MAANVLTTVMFELHLILLCCLCTSRTFGYTTYEISSSNENFKLPNSRFLLNFASHSNQRFRRQSGGVNTDAATNSSQIDTNARNASTPSALFSTTTAPISDPEGSNDGDTLDDPDIIHDFHTYYTSDVLTNKFSEHWVELENVPRHETLSTAHRVAAVLNLKFDFYFYGHKVTNVTVATGGFMYMSPFLHQWLTATQYIAPLMANFDPSFSPNSSILFQSEENRFIVEWKNLVLRDQNTTGMFHFQVILSDNGTIKFIYKSIPFPVANISNDEHPVKVGLSDAYYNDTYIPENNIKRRTIYEYHKVVLPVSKVTTGNVIILTPLPTCNRLNDCDTCVRHVNVKFDCRWCSALGRCSDGLDWYRQHWDKQGCQTTKVDKCEMTTTAVATNSSTSSSSQTLVKNSTSEVTFPTTLTSVRTLSSGAVNAKAYRAGAECADGKCKNESDVPVAVIVIVVLVIFSLLAALVGWVYYAYTHPTSRSGMWLMEHRPSQLKSKIKFWKSSADAGAMYKVESEA